MRKSKALWVGIAVWLLWSSWGEAEQIPIQQLYAEGLQALQERQMFQAERTFQQILDRDSTFYDAYIQLARMYKGRKELDRVEKLLLAAMRQDFGRVEALFEYSQVLHSKGRNRQAYAYLKKVLELEPETPAAHMGIGLMRMKPDQMMDLSEAEGAFGAVLAFEPAHYEAVFNLGKVLMYQGKWESARDAFRRILEGKPGNFSALYQLGILHYREGDYQSAVEDLQQALVTSPNNPIIRWALGLVYKRLGGYPTELDSSFRFTTIPPKKIPGLEVTLVDVAPQMGVNRRDLGRGSSWADYDGDGDLDLYLVNATGVNCLFENTAGQFSEVATTAGLADAGNGRGLAFGDYDGDGDIDLFVANQTGGSHFFRNDRGTFRDVNRHLGLEFAGGEVGAVFGDYDDDGDLDLFLSSETGPSYLNRNEGGFSFERVVGKDSLYLGSQTVGAAFLDYDNDGDLDLATTALRAEAGGDALYQNRGDGMFISVGELLQLRTESSGRGLSFSDYDGDGDLDLFIADSRRSHFYRNTADPTHWLQVELEGPPVNRQGLGASVELVAGGRPQYRELQSAFGYGSQVQPGVHFGLGTAVQADTLRVRWPDGLQTIQFGLRAGQRLLLFHPRLSTAVTEAEGRDLGRFRLFSNVPNPFNAGTIIHFELPRSGEMELAVFNVLGQPVRGLINGVLDAGVYQVAWNGRDEGGRNLGSGVYFCRLAGDGRVQTRRMLLLK